MIETTAITAMTPMTIPNNVSNDRRRFARSEESATEMASRKFIFIRTSRYYTDDGDSGDKGSDPKATPRIHRYEHEGLTPCLLNHRHPRPRRSVMIRR